MEILAIGNPPTQPISGKTPIKICPKCQAVLKYNYEDMWVKHKNGFELNFITCMSCGTEMPISELKRDEYKRKS